MPLIIEAPAASSQRKAGSYFGFAAARRTPGSTIEAPSVQYFAGGSIIRSLKPLETYAD
jgi:hypothetical protein